MPVVQRRLGIAIGTVVVLAIAITAAVPTLRRSSPTFNFLFSPSDLYEPLSDETVDFAKEGASYQLSFENKYPGLHWFAVQVAKPQPAATAYEGNFGLRLEVRMRGKPGKPLFSELIKGPGSPYWSSSKNGGFVVHFYRSPDDLPLREPLEADVTIVQADEAFATKYGPFKLVVRKLSDE